MSDTAAPELSAVASDADERPVVRLKSGAHKRLLHGHPWAYSNEVAMDAETRALPLGAVVRLESADGEGLGTALYNRLPLIAARLLTRDPRAEIDAGFLEERLRRALTIRERLFDEPYYRLVHAESDGLPGTIIDRFGDTLVLQVNTAGMERLTDALVEALDRLLAPARILLRNEGPARKMEGLEDGTVVLRGSFDGPIELLENGARYLADPGEGQKTGWFYDQRDNRAWAARLAQDARVFDGYCYSGGFTVQAALAGAREVLSVDRSQSALDLAAQAAALNGVAERCRFQKAEVFKQLEGLSRNKESFDLVIVDPPAFIKTKKDLFQGTKGYRKLARLAAEVVAPQGYLLIASCSHHMAPDAFAEQVRRGIANAGRQARVLHAAGAGPDHPVHPALPETAYLKALVLAFD